MRQAAAAAGFSLRTDHAWLSRFRSEDAAGLEHCRYRTQAIGWELAHVAVDDSRWLTDGSKRFRHACKRWTIRHRRTRP